MKIINNDALQMTPTVVLDTDEMEGFPKTKQVTIQIGQSRFTLREQGGCLIMIPYNAAGEPTRLIMTPDRTWPGAIRMTTEEM